MANDFHDDHDPDGKEVFDDANGEDVFANANDEDVLDDVLFDPTMADTSRLIVWCSGWCSLIASNSNSYNGEDVLYDPNVEDVFDVTNGEEVFDDANGNYRRHFSVYCLVQWLVLANCK